MPAIKLILLTATVLVVISVIYLVVFRKKKDPLSAIIARERKMEQLAKSGNQNPQITVIDDPQELAILRKKLTENIENERQKRLREPKDEIESLALAYRQHHPSAIPSILSILKGPYMRKKADMYFALGSKYDDPETYTITEPELIEQIFKAVEHHEEEGEAIQLAGICHIPGYEKVFEKRLLSGKSTDEGRLFYWLSQATVSETVLQYAEQRIKSKTLSQKTLDQFINGLENIAERNSDDIKAWVGNTALYIYNNRLLNADRYEELKSSEMTSDAAETVLSCIFKYGDQRAVPIAKDIINRNIRIEEPVVALIRLEGPQHLQKVRQYLRSKDKFHKGLSIIEMMDSSLISDELLGDVLVQLSKQSDVQDHTLLRIIRDFERLGAVKFITQPDNMLLDKTFTNRVKTLYQKIHISVDTIMNDLMDCGIIKKKPAKEILEKLLAEADGDPSSLIYQMLDKENRLLSFDAEADVVPVPYDSLIYEFVQKSGGPLSNILVWMDTGGDYDQFEKYEITVVGTDKAYIIEPADLDDWYDVQLVEALINRVLQDKKSAEYFIPVNTGDQTALYIFGEPAKIKALTSKYDIY